MTSTIICGLSWMCRKVRWASRDCWSRNLNTSPTRRPATRLGKADDAGQENMDKNPHHIAAYRA